MPINVMTSRQEVTNFLRECAKFAYGSGIFGGRSGGAGNIGFLPIVSAARQAAKTVCESDAANADRLDAQAWEIGIMA